MQIKIRNCVEGVAKVLSTEAARTKSARWREVPLNKSASAALTRLEAESENDFFMPARELP